MSLTKAKAVLFDLDGTLLDTLQDLATSGNEVLAGRGLPPHPLDAYRTFIGNGMVNLARDVFPPEMRPETEEQIAAVLEEYRAAYSRNWTKTTVPFPGIAGVLDRLVADRIPIGVVSNKAHDFTLQCVETFLGDWKWDVLIGAREGHPRKPDPAGALEAAAVLGVAPEDCLFVGDSDVDMMTAKAAGMRAIGVSWGFRPVEELNWAGAEVILETPADLLAWVG
ncbi:MAG: HAD-IA family hydrolase [Verrucomicrobiales bacterium]|nr:HAD-IA family hydrolase [Verrucomicrobiales bacterium]